MSYVRTLKSLRLPLPPTLRSVGQEAHLTDLESSNVPSLSLKKLIVWPVTLVNHFLDAQGEVQRLLHTNAVEDISSSVDRRFKLANPVSNTALASAFADSEPD